MCTVPCRPRACSIRSTKPDHTLTNPDASPPAACDAATPQVSCSPPDPMLSWQQSSVPILVSNTSSVDVVKASCGSRHAALITRAGELYTWGHGTGTIPGA